MTIYFENLTVGLYVVYILNTHFKFLTIECYLLFKK